MTPVPGWFHSTRASARELSPFNFISMIIIIIIIIIFFFFFFF